MHAIVNRRLCYIHELLLLLEAVSCKGPINPVTNPNTLIVTHTFGNIIAETLLVGKKNQGAEVA